ncbi:MAG: arginine transporter [Rhodobacteraceae bacterium]|nr:arginine transporter [Paracoccaceae bacterium]
MRFLFSTLMIFSLASCGGSSSRVPAGVTLASGPISEACQRSGRSAASRQLCQCIQGVANQELSGSDQRRGASFFGNPELAQSVRLNDSPSADAFWARWTDFASTAEDACSMAL